jgi:hypothetical protein
MEDIIDENDEEDKGEENSVWESTRNDFDFGKMKSKSKDDNIVDQIKHISSLILTHGLTKPKPHYFHMKVYKLNLGCQYTN